MKINISSIFDENIDIIYHKLQNPNTLIKIASPILKFKAIIPDKLPNKWELNKIYKLKLFLFNFIPLGFHEITVIKIDDSKYEIVSNEFGKIAKTWNHYIYLKKINNKKSKYTDIVEIKAGVLTIIVYLFALFFYNHRQRKWKKILKSDE